MEPGKIIFYNIVIISVLIFLIGVISSQPILNISSGFGSIIPTIGITVLSMSECILFTINNIIINTILQKQVPLEMMGRVSSVRFAIIVSIIPLGQMLFGILYDYISVSITIFILSIILCIVIFMAKKSLFKI